MRNIHIVIIYILLGALIGYQFFFEKHPNKVVYVDNLELFSGFHMKAELEKKYTEAEAQRKAILDSIYRDIKVNVEMKGISGSESIALMKRQFLMKKEQFDQENTQTRNDYNTKIWNQLNEYTREYGKEQGYDFILGANGQGVLMYANELKNITPDLIRYVNQKFDGK